MSAQGTERAAVQVVRRPPTDGDAVVAALQPRASSPGARMLAAAANANNRIARDGVRGAANAGAANAGASNAQAPAHHNLRSVQTWANTLTSKRRRLRSTFGIACVVAVVSLACVLALSKIVRRDLVLLALLALTLVAAVPYIEVAVPAGGRRSSSSATSSGAEAAGASAPPIRSSFYNRLRRKPARRAAVVTDLQWQAGLGGRERLDVLSSRAHFLQPMLPIFSMIGFVMFGLYKCAGEQVVTYHTVLLLLLVQLPFNPLLGYNPLGKYLLRQPVSRTVTQQNVRRFLNAQRAAAPAAARAAARAHPAYDD